MIVAVDHFAGTGWGVACRWLGIHEYGVEIMPAAIRTRGKVGFRTIYRDVWAGLLHSWLVPPHDLYIASPPCQTFSVAGRGNGRRALDQVLRLIDAGVWKDAAKLKATGSDLGDDRTALVLTPLAHIWAHRPRLVALEQVPTVLPVWEAVAEVLRRLGYSVWTGNLQAEMYGVPQTRKRAILMARLDGPVAPPTPTHSRYYSREPARLDPGVQKWVSMAEALGWSKPALVGFPRLADSQESVEIAGVAYRARDLRSSSHPGQTVTEKARSWSAWDEDGCRRITSADAAALQSYPIGWGFTDRPAMTVHGHGLLTRGPSGQKQAIMAGLEAGTFIPRPPFTIESARKPGEQRDDYVSLSDRYEPDAVNFTPEEAAVLQSYPDWTFSSPSPTIAADPRVAPRGCKHPKEGCCSAWPGVPGRQFPEGTVRLDENQAATLQSFPAPFPFQGSRGKQFLQIGNAVPPLLARAILAALIADPAPVEIPAAVDEVDEWAEFALMEPVFG